MVDVDVLIEHADAAPHARQGPMASVGYWMSGPFAFAVAASRPDRIAAAASIHGIRLHGEAPDSPHLGADRIKAETLLRLRGER